MKPFGESPAGRLLTVAGALPLAAGAALVWDNGGIGTVAIIAAIFAGILLGIVGLGLALEEHGAYAVAGVMFLPPALLLYTPLIAFAMHAPAVRVALGLAALALFALALRSKHTSPTRVGSQRQLETKWRMS
jgi:hypothetical protein